MGRAVSAKTARLNIDKSLPSDQQLELQLAIPDLTVTEKLLITMKHNNDQKVNLRKQEKEQHLHVIKEQKRLKQERAEAALLKK